MAKTCHGRLGQAVKVDICHWRLILSLEGALYHEWWIYTVEGEFDTVKGDLIIIKGKYLYHEKVLYAVRGDYMPWETDMCHVRCMP